MNFSRRQHEIIRAALELTAEGGLLNLTTRNLAERIGVSEPALYRHFPGKHAIISGMIDYFDAGIVLPDKLEGFSGIRSFVFARLEQISQEPLLAKLLFSEELFIHDEVFSARLQQMMHRHRELLGEAVETGKARGEIRSDIPDDTLFRLILGPVRLLVRQWGISGMKFDLKQQGTELMDALETLLKGE